MWIPDKLVYLVSLMWFTAGFCHFTSLSLSLSALCECNICVITFKHKHHYAYGCSIPLHFKIVHKYNVLSYTAKFLAQTSPFLTNKWMFRKFSAIHSALVVYVTTEVQCCSAKGFIRTWTTIFGFLLGSFIRICAKILNNWNGATLTIFSRLRTNFKKYTPYFSRLHF